MVAPLGKGRHTGLPYTTQRRNQTEPLPGIEAVNAKGEQTEKIKPLRIAKLSAAALPWPSTKFQPAARCPGRPPVSPRSRQSRLPPLVVALRVAPIRLRRSARIFPRSQRANLCAGIEAVESRHADVEEHRVRVKALDHFNAAPAIRRSLDLVAPFAQQQGIHFAGARTVVDDQ